MAGVASTSSCTNTASTSASVESVVAISSRDRFVNYINLHDLCFATSTDEKTLEFCQFRGLLPKQVPCPSCARPLVKIQVRHFSAGDRRPSLLFRCQKKGCGKTVSARKNTWFDGIHISLKKSLFLTYMFVVKADYNLAIQETSGAGFDFKTTSSETVADHYSYCREVCAESLFVGGEAKKIGGLNFVVEIDEAKFGKRKFNKGRVVEGQWVLGGICRETKETFFVPVPDRSADTLLPIIVQHVAAGSVIYTDEWRAYGNLCEVGFEHGTVNHSLHFRDPESGVHTNTIESTWWSLKRSLPATHTQKKYFASHLAEYIWRRQHAESPCVFVDFLQSIASVYPGLDA